MFDSRAVFCHKHPFSECLFHLIRYTNSAVHNCCPSVLAAQDLACVQTAWEWSSLCPSWDIKKQRYIKAKHVFRIIFSKQTKKTNETIKTTTTKKLNLLTRILGLVDYFNFLIFQKKLKNHSKVEWIYLQFGQHKEGKIHHFSQCFQYLCKVFI